MPTKSKKGGTKKRRYNRWKRKQKKGNFNQNLSKDVFWFKKCGDIPANASGELYLRITPNDIFPIPSFVNMCRNYEQYKVLKVITKFYPAYIGSETSTQSPANNGFRRGNVVTYIEQPPFDPQPTAGQISLVMGFPSAKLHQTRSTIKRWMSRPSGGRYLDWSRIQHFPPNQQNLVPYPNPAPDPWDSEIRIFGDNFSTTPANNKPYFFVEYLFQVIFRSKYRGP